MKKFIIASLIALSAVAQAAPVKTTPQAPLIGEWRSDDVSGGADKGTLILTPGGAITLAPDGFEPLKGQFAADGAAITADMGPNGKAKIGYKLDAGNKVLHTTYPDGRTQTFNRVVTHPKK